MQAEISVGMVLGVGSDLVQPGTGNHHAGGSDRVFVESIKTGCVFGVSDREIIGVDDEQFGVAWIAQALGNGFGL